MNVGDERHLVLRALAGEESACEELYDRHGGRVMAYLLRSGFVRADADDLTQEVFLRAFKSLRTFDAARGAFAAWVGAIARNVARRQWGKRRGGESFDSQLAEEMFAAPSDDRTTVESQEENIKKSR